MSVFLKRSDSVRYGVIVNLFRAVSADRSFAKAYVALSVKRQTNAVSDVRESAEFVGRAESYRGATVFRYGDSVVTERSRITFIFIGKRGLLIETVVIVTDYGAFFSLRSVTSPTARQVPPLKVISIL